MINLLEDYSGKQAEQERALRRLQEESAEHVKNFNAPEQRHIRLRSALHEANCNSNHTDGCGYYMAAVHTPYEEVAKKLAQFLTDNNIDSDYACSNKSFLKDVYRMLR